LPSFDVVSEVDKHELANAVDQTMREIGTRFDFKGSSADISISGDNMLLKGDSEFQIKQIHDILFQKMSKRGIDVGSLELGDVGSFAGNKAQQNILVRQGIDKDLARKIVKVVKETKLKVQAAIQGEQVRVTGKKRDDLQQIMSKIKSADLGQPFQYNNFRD
jgi:uncharacterized protein YajQ (UPF0234 family)